MKFTWKSVRRQGQIALLASSAMVFQTSGCDVGTIAATQTTVTTFDGRAAILQLLRGVIIGPIDAALANAVNGIGGSNNP